MFFAKKPFTILLVLGSPQRSSAAFIKEKAAQADVLIACDSGAEVCAEARVKIDVLIGDNDSISPDALAYARGCGAYEQVHPIDKDETDLKLALNYIWSIYAPKHKHIDTVVTCATGGRPDHAFAVFGTLIEAQALHPRIEEDDYSCYIMSHEWDNNIIFEPQLIGHTVSVVGLENPTHITLQGMRWNKDNWAIRPLSDEGISNIVEEVGASLRVHSGSVACFIMREIQHKTR